MPNTQRTSSAVGLLLALLLIGTVAGAGVTSAVSIFDFLRAYIGAPESGTSSSSASSSSAASPAGHYEVAPFADVPATHPFHVAIEYGHVRGYFQGYPDYTFQPESIMNRAEFTKIIVSIRFEQSSVERCTAPLPYTDTEDSAWYAPSLCIASQWGIISGNPDGSLHPGDPVNVAEASKIVVAALGIPTFQQVSSPWYRRYVEALTAQNAYPATILTPDHLLTRGEMAEMLFRVKHYTQSGSLFILRGSAPESRDSFIIPVATRGSLSAGSGSLSSSSSSTVASSATSSITNSPSSSLGSSSSFSSSISLAGSSSGNSSNSSASGFSSSSSPGSSSSSTPFSSSPGSSSNFSTPPNSSSSSSSSSSGLSSTPSSSFSSSVPLNQPPNVNAGNDVTIEFPNAITLNGSATDDGIPIPPILTAMWSKVDAGSTPGTVTFTAPNALGTDGSFLGPGTFILRLTVSDGALSASDTLTVTVNPDITAPLITNIRAIGVDANTVTITWTTNEASDSQVEFGPTATYGQLVPPLAAPTLVTNHSIQLTGLIPQAQYHFRVKSGDLPGNLATSPDQIAATGFIGNPNPQILLTQTALAALRAKAAAGAPEWLTFKAKLDAQLPLVIAGSTGSHLPLLDDFALGYQALILADPVTAANYADKAIGLLMSAVGDYPVEAYTGRQFLARGDGATRDFALAHSDVIPSSLTAYLSRVTTVSITRLSAPMDPVGNAADCNIRVLKVSNAPDGSADYVQATDWRQSDDTFSNCASIDWSPAGGEPAQGATYYVTFAKTVTGPADTPVTLISGNVIRFPVGSAPQPSQAIFVSYVYGARAADYGSLAYQQTGQGGGGARTWNFAGNTVARNLVGSVSIGYDWLYDYPGFNLTQRLQVASLMVNWSDNLRTSGFFHDKPETSADAWYYGSRALAALAIGGGRDANGPRFKTEVTSYRGNTVIPYLRRANASPLGGFWSEGWVYGASALQSDLLAGLAMETAGWITAADTLAGERPLSSEVMLELLYEQPTRATIFDGGDGSAYPRAFPSKDLLYLLAVAADNSSARSYANHLINTYEGGAQTNTYLSFILRDPTAPASDWTLNLPLSHHATGMGVVTARAAWDYAGTWFGFFLGNRTQADHQIEAPGHIQIQRGTDALLINANALSGNDKFFRKSQYSNLIAVNDNDLQRQTYPFNMDVWYGSPGVSMNRYEAAADYVYAEGNYRAAYSHVSQPGGGGPVVKLVRQVVYLRPNLFVIHDRVATDDPFDAKELRFHFLNDPTVTSEPAAVGQTVKFTETVGSSKLFGQVFTQFGVTASVDHPAPNQSLPSLMVPQLRIWNPVLRLEADFTTILETAPSSKPAQEPVRRIASIPSIEGAQIGSTVVTFGMSGVHGDAAMRGYSFDGTVPTKHLITDLLPFAQYLVSAGSVSTLTASSQGVLYFDVPAGVSTATFQFLQ